MKHRSSFFLLLDEHENNPHFLSEAILRHLGQQEKEEYCLTPPPHQEMAHPLLSTSDAPQSVLPANNDWHHPEPMTREPTLMFSLERPQPLMEPVENTEHF